MATVPKAVKIMKKLKYVKKKFFDMTDSSTSPCDIMPCWFESPENVYLSEVQNDGADFYLQSYKYGTRTLSSETTKVGN